jgi:hypothetical protein
MTFSYVELTLLTIVSLHYHALHEMLVVGYLTEYRVGRVESRVEERRGVDSRLEIGEHALS